MSEHLLRAQEFLRICDQFKLGKLPTENFHPKTKNLSQLAQDDLKQALSLLKELDTDAIKIVHEKISDIFILHRKIKETFLKGHKVFLCGCGATGRLSIALETFYRQSTAADNVISFMAGGDVALIKSIESFEDKVSYGARQLLELGFSNGDLLISSSEGGETPFVIGATQEAAKISKQKPYFFFCNPSEILRGLVERSREVIENPKIEEVELLTGPMALSGSTRMQASTVLMMAIGLALLYNFNQQSELENEYKKILKFTESIDYNFLIPFIEEESKLYLAGENVLYETTSNLGISILTDTTERSPTFNLTPYENDLDEDSPVSLSYLSLSDTKSAAEAWSALLGRRPRVLDWQEFEGQIGLERIYGFDISSKSKNERARRISKKQSLFKINAKANNLHCELNQAKAHFSYEGQSLLALHLVIKMLFNAHSTLVMGRLGRYSDNIMTWVKPSNYKLIDRSVRYVQKLLSNKGIDKNYEDLVYECFEMIPKITSGKSLVLEVVKKLS